MLLVAATTQATSGDEVTDWHGQMLVTLRNAGTNPVVSTRDAALVSAAVFDAVNGIERRYAPIHISSEAPRGASKRAAAVQAAYAVLLARYPAQAATLAERRDESLAAIGEIDGQSLQRGLAWGQQVATAILAWRSSDGFTPAPAPFVGGPEPGRWRPTPPSFAAGAAPQFATMTPWGIETPDQFRPFGPPALDSEQYLSDYLETLVMGAAASPERSSDQTDACLFWNSTSPTWFWNRAALDLIGGDDDAALSDNARLLAQLNLSMADALIACWDAKYYFQFWRPITAIQIEDPAWTPLLATPAHPEYPSGHSTVSSAGAFVLAATFGDDVPFYLESQVNPAWTRGYLAFSESLVEVADARVFAGIHFRTACDDGVSLGADVASFVLENQMRRVHGQGD